MSKDFIIPLAAIIGLITLGINALWLGIDSGLLVGIGSIIGGLGGYKIKTYREKQAKK